ncbi:MAG: cyanophycin synthetase, partial [Gemmatimonadota bacterium]
RTSLTGPFNCSNVMAAVACGLALGVDGEAIGAGIAAVESVPGRFERVDAGQPFLVIVDYAHTPAGLENVLAAARQLTAGKLICLFGCGGDRDRGKRPLMGRAVEQLADVAVVTSDNPRSEAPAAIIAAIVAGMESPAQARVEPDRARAIAAALEAAVPGDAVVIAGKGSEGYQIFADRTVPFDDREVARHILRRLVGAATT